MVVLSSKPVGTQSTPQLYKYLTCCHPSTSTPSHSFIPTQPSITKSSTNRQQRNRRRSMESKTMERVSSSVQSWVEEHKLSTIGGVWAAAVGASVAYSRRRAPQRATGIRLIHARIHAQALTLAALGGAAAFVHYRNKSKKNADDELDHDFYSQLPPATDADGNENERWSW